MAKKGPTNGLHKARKLLREKLKSRIREAVQTSHRSGVEVLMPDSTDQGQDRHAQSKGKR